MGVYHFMGVGRAVGAVTCAVDYIEKALDIAATDNTNEEIAKLFRSSGGIKHDESERGKIEAIVLFTSKEVIDNELKAFPYINSDDPGYMRSELLRNLKKVWKRSDSDEGRKVFWCEVDIDNFQDCLEKIVKVAYRFSPINKQGKEIWCNLTGGANSINLGLLSMAGLAGLSTKHYLISQRKQYQKEVKVPSAIQLRPNKDNYFNIVPFIKTQIDTINFYEVVVELEDIKKSIKTEDLLSRLKSKGKFINLQLDSFRRQYMLKLYGLNYVDYDREADLVTITETGVGFVSELEELEASIALEEKLLQNDVDIIEESKNWSWFQEIDILEKNEMI